MIHLSDTPIEIDAIRSGATADDGKTRDVTLSLRVRATLNGLADCIEGRILCSILDVWDEEAGVYCGDPAPKPPAIACTIPSLSLADVVWRIHQTDRVTGVVTPLVLLCGNIAGTPKLTIKGAEIWVALRVQCASIDGELLDALAGMLGATDLYASDATTDDGEES